MVEKEEVGVCEHAEGEGERKRQRTWQRDRRVGNQPSSTVKAVFARTFWEKKEKRQMAKGETLPQCILSMRKVWGQICWRQQKVELCKGDRTWGSRLKEGGRR